MKWLAALAILLLPSIAHAQTSAAMYCQTATSSTGYPTWAPASSANPCPVSGNTGGYTGLATASPTVSTSAYSAGYDIGGLITLTGLVRSGQTSGMIQNVLANFADSQANAQLYAVLFNANPSSSTITDHSALGIAAADQGKIVAVVPITYCQTTGTPTTCEALQLAISYASAASGGPLYMALATQAAITLASTSDLKITVIGPQD